MFEVHIKGMAYANGPDVISCRAARRYLIVSNHLGTWQRLALRVEAAAVKRAIAGNCGRHAGHHCQLRSRPSWRVWRQSSKSIVRTVDLEAGMLVVIEVPRVQLTAVWQGSHSLPNGRPLCAESSFSMARTSSPWGAAPTPEDLWASSHLIVFLVVGMLAQSGWESVVMPGSKLSLVGLQVALEMELVHRRRSTPGDCRLILMDRRGTPLSCCPFVNVVAGMADSHLSSCACCHATDLLVSRVMGRELGSSSSPFSVGSLALHCRPPRWPI